ncbi:uncharacterized protein EDB91DRAFT_1081883 [Suillus paluster]|uniref:uncharacterized protein n=1 Tax=Suillus paluster TaxID=48578 RepID=UPI001B86DF54|nr:uncharacterized protein EDB91DRAFT_1081883 [Suillus paluster]KAG1740803.1 hypothetical protein EDB91DRAFT_1081883 [Suillus paluster]
MSLLYRNLASGQPVDSEDVGYIRMHILWYRYPYHWGTSERTSYGIGIPLIGTTRMNKILRYIKTVSLNLYCHSNMPPRRRGQKSQVTTVPTHAAVTPTAAAPIDATPIITPITAAIVPIAATVAPIAATVAPIAAAVALNAAMLQHPQSRTPDDREYIDIGDVSGDEEDNLPAPSVRAPPVPSPLQTVTSTIYSTQVDPLATGVRGTQPKSTADINHFFREDSATKRKIC